MSEKEIAPFHYAFKVSDLSQTERFYIDLLGCQAGRRSEHWLDFNLFGNQLSAHLSDNLPRPDLCGEVDGIKVPIPHFGCVLSIEKFNEIKERLEKAQVKFIIKPQRRYEGRSGEQLTMFIYDPSGNPIEFKAYVRSSETFAV